MKKKIFMFLFLFFLFGISVPVYADVYETNVLIPVDTVATVSTDKFQYNDFVFSSTIDSKGNSLVRFTSIQNNTLSKTAVSINMLLFGKDKKNIGFLTYCTDKDVSSEYAGFKLSGGQSSPFSISVTTRYFADGYSAKDVGYVAVMDENKYCQIGGYDNYLGMTLEEIVGEATPSEVNESAERFSFLQDRKVQEIILTIVGVVMALMINGIVLNTLYKKMYGKTTSLAYLPITNIYICVKMAFGKIVAGIFIALFLLLFLLVYIGVEFAGFLAVLLYVASFVVVLIKLITKNYDMLYFEPSMKMETPLKPNVSDSNVSNSIDTNTSLSSDSYLDQPTLDLSYDDSFHNNDILDPFHVSAGMDGSNKNLDENSDENGESDLSKFFH